MGGLIFIAIGSPIATILALTTGIKISFILILISQIELVIFLIVLMGKILARVFSDKNKDWVGELEKVVNILIVLVTICLLLGAWSMSEQGNKKHSHDYDNTLFGLRKTRTAFADI